MHTNTRLHTRLKKARIPGPGQHAWVYTPLCLLVLLFFSSCGVLSGPDLKPTATPPVVTIQPIVTPHRPYLAVDAWLDITGSVPSGYFLSAKNGIANSIDSYIRPNEDGAVFYVSFIAHNSFQPESTKLVITVPPIPADPPQPQLLAYPSQTGDPFTDSQNKQRVDAEHTRRLTAWQQTLKAQHAALAQLQTQIKQETDSLRRLHPQQDASATDIYGALERAGLRFQYAPKASSKYLILQTDLENNTLAQDTNSLRLVGVSVWVIWDTSENAPETQANTAFWQQVVMAAGAKAFQVFDPGASEAIQNSLFS